MRTIQKQISLEPMTSRLPSVWPAYYDNEYYYFDNNSLKEREWEYTSNWGMVPVNIVLNDKPYSSHTSDYYSVVEGCHCYGGCYKRDVGNRIACSSDTTTKCESECPDSYAELCNFVLSFENLSKWYYFFNEYYNLLKQYSHCNRVYTSAEDYYNYESGTKYEDQMIYGTDKQTYLDLDKEFADKGGRVEVLVFDKDTSEYIPKTPEDAHDEKKTPTDRMSMVDVYDIGFFKWISDNVVPYFEIPKKWKDYWKVDKLFYPDVVKWLAWFQQREPKQYEATANFKKGVDGELDTWECKSQTIEDCCDCEEYFSRGGDEIYQKLLAWYNNIQEIIESNNEMMPEDGTCYIPTIILPTELQVSIDDLGEFSIFSSDYELGIDYRTAKALTETANTNSGTVTTMDGNSIILQNNSSGFTFDRVYMEKYVSSCKTCEYKGVFYGVCPKCGSKDIDVIGWKDYTEKYVLANKNDFHIHDIAYFAYNDSNVKFTSSASTEDAAKEDLAKQMAKKYHLTTRENGWILIDNVLYPINEIEYATYDKSNKYLGNKRYMIFREKGTNMPYTYINGKQIYSTFYEPKNKFYFPFFKKPNAGVDGITCSGRTFNFNDYISFDRNQSGETMYYIYYNDNAYEVIGDIVSINGYRYYKISGYSIDDSSETLYLTYDGDIRSGDTLEIVVNAYTIQIDNEPYVEVKIPFDVELYSVDEINGKTVSKLADLRLYDVLTDDVGNDIDGIYPIDNYSIKNYQPPEGTVLEPIYQVGNTDEITRFSLTVEDLDDVKDGKNYFVGNIIKEMKFYYKEYDGTIPEETIVDVLLDSDDTYQIKINYTVFNESSEGWEKKIKIIQSGYTSLSAISISTSAKTKLEENEEESHVFYDDIFCDVTYYIGATLRRKEGENFNICYEENRSNYGVEYTETVQFVKENREYYLKKPPKSGDVIPSKVNDVSRHSISYPIYVYKMRQQLEHVDDSQYDSSYEVPMADFRFNINIFSGDSDTFKQKYSGDMASHNDLQVFPVFREEYRLGSSVIENIDSDIYIDRGINAAFEKHLKLGEVTSLEALEQYGNGYFKIMES